MLQRFRAAVFVTLLAFSAAFPLQAQTPSASGSSGAPDVPARATAGFDPADLDRAVKPCDDFYQFACGGWRARNPVPADRGRWGRFDELAERNQAALRGILEKAARPDAARARLDAQIGDYYGSCMDEAAIEKKGLAPLQDVFDRIARLKDKAELPALLNFLHDQGVGALFQHGAQPDFKNSGVSIAALDQGGLGLPDRDYYLKDDERFRTVREAYVPHVSRMFTLLGTPSVASATSQAQGVLELETALARASMDRVKRRDPVNRYHKMTRADLAALAPGFDWNAYFTAVGPLSWNELNVASPDFVKEVGALMGSRSLGAWQDYLRWRVVRDAAPLLPAAFVAENFDFYGRTLTGAKDLRPRWKRCVEMVDDHLGEALGQRYVEATFGAEGKLRMATMVRALESALERDIRELPWMTEATRTRALEKLAAVADKIGYPERWRDYSALRIVGGDALGNARRSEAFERARDLRKIGQVVDPTEWRMTPPTVNAYYSSLENNINFPAGILQPPFFDKTLDDAVNFGAIGSVIGHELTHGFDDSGRKFDPRGNLADWWTAEDGREFEQRASCVADQYSAYTVAEGVNLNGRLTLGENVADNGGVRIAHLALRETLQGAPAPLRDGFTPEQRLFLGWGQIWCQNTTEENSKLRAQTDPHSPGRYRVNGVVSNMPEFQQAFSCPADAPMVRDNACRVW